MRDKIRALMVLEIIGKPPQYLVESLENIIRQMGNEPGVAVKNKEIKEPKKMEEKAGIAIPAKGELKIEEQQFYVSFGEIDVEVDNLLSLIMLMFKYMPAHIEIFSPENLAVSNFELNDALNDLILRLHKYDEVARILQNEYAKLQTKLMAIEESKTKKDEKNKAKSKKKKK